MHHFLQFTDNVANNDSQSSCVSLATSIACDDLRNVSVQLANVGMTIVPLSAHSGQCGDTSETCENVQ